ncbi:hypothetical protein [Thermosulfurimonas sp. F29]|uniref:hypothetical protein n=1 Tax=Thermosulfurimonas sp. F29 TaxID=2867247 RepID=UPI001C833209|nr:hypothetical protein [Thermosulfurimonas sp. F29]MBX6423365.1 hypothetical protein [Thermosulfurimonas sp. F29]
MTEKMKVLSFDLGGGGSREFVRRARRRFVAAMAAGMAFLSAIAPQAGAGDWREAFFEVVGAAAGTMLTDRRDSDLERAAAAVAGTAAGAVLYSALTGKTLDLKQTMARGISAGATAMTGSRQDSDLERGIKAATGVVVYEGLRWMVQTNGENRTALQASSPRKTEVPRKNDFRQDAETRCHLRRVYVEENGRVVSQRVEEVCEATKRMPGYYPAVGGM